MNALEKFSDQEINSEYHRREQLRILKLNKHLHVIIILNDDEGWAYINSKNQDLADRWFNCEESAISHAQKNGYIVVDDFLEDS